jgi:hypothetical protein
MINKITATLFFVLVAVHASQLTLEDEEFSVPEGRFLASQTCSSKLNGKSCSFSYNCKSLCCQVAKTVNGRSDSTSNGLCVVSGPGITCNANERCPASSGSSSLTGLFWLCCCCLLPICCFIVCIFALGCCGTASAGAAGTAATAGAGVVAVGSAGAVATAGAGALAVGTGAVVVGGSAAAIGGGAALYANMSSASSHSSDGEGEERKSKKQLRKEA